MFKALKNLFIKQETPPDEEFDGPQYESSICYACNEDGEIFVDVDIKDYNEQTINNFARILCGISSFNFHIETLNIIKNGFIENDRIDLFQNLLNEILKISKEEVFAYQDKLGKENEEPCIKPSDML